MPAWYEDEEFWRDNYEVMFSADAFRRAAEDIDHVLALTANEPRRVLDLCCGPGRFTIPLAQKGLALTAVDLSPFLLDRARENARAAHVNAEFVQADMRSFVRPNSFDAVLSLYTSFGYFDDRRDDERVLANIYENLRPGGTTIIDVIVKELQGRRGDRVTDLSDGATCVQRIQVVDDWTAVKAEWLVVRGDSARRYRFTHRLYSGFELRTAMEGAGFKVSLFGDFGGTPYGPESLRLIAVGQKPDAAAPRS
jgi:SAM-dependent methyltransferase